MGTNTGGQCSAGAPRRARGGGFISAGERHGGSRGAPRPHILRGPLHQVPGADVAESGRRLSKAKKQTSWGSRVIGGTGERPELWSEVNNSLIIVNFFHKIQNFRQNSDLFSQI